MNAKARAVPQHLRLPGWLICYLSQAFTRLREAADLPGLGEMNHLGTECRIRWI